MALLIPTQLFRDVSAITPEYLAGQGIRALVLDVDNTLTAHGSQEVSPAVSDWLARMKAAGIGLAIASNNFEKRVAPFAQRIGVQHVSFCCKPAPFGLARARHILGVERGALALVGDQIFTDSLGAHLYGIKMLLVRPVTRDIKMLIRARRWLEQPLLRRYFEQGGTIL